jgi:uncharacterized membrane protein YbhN (UPF0104 family)
MPTKQGGHNAKRPRAPNDALSATPSGDGAQRRQNAPPEEPASSISRRQLLFAVALIVLALVGLYLLVPKIAGLKQTWGKLAHGDPWWLCGAVGVELLSIAGYAVLFRTIFGRGVPRLTWGVSIEIPLAGIAAIRLLAAGGAGAVAVTVWALDHAGLDSQVIACRMVANLILQYAVYLGAVIVFGIALGSGLLAGQRPVELTLLPALVSLLIAALVLSAVLVPDDVDRRLRQISSGPRWWRRLIERLAAAPAALGSGARTAVDLVRQRRLGSLGAPAYWGFDIAALDCSFHAFGGHPALAVLVLGYFLGTLGGLLPIPGGIGGVEGAMIGAFVAFGIAGGEAIVAVLAYRAISFWLPTLPGIGGYFALRRTVRQWDAAAKRAAG